MTNGVVLRCDGCGQQASPEHVAQRLRRLEWSTRYRPVHIGTLLLAAVAPRRDADFLYSSAGEFAGEAQVVLEAAGVSAGGKSPDAALSEFQRGGFVLAHVLECPLEEDSGTVQELLSNFLPSTLTRIRRSLKPKRVALVSEELSFAVADFQSGKLHCELLLDGGKPFALSGEVPKKAAERLRQILAASSAAAR